MRLLRILSCTTILVYVVKTAANAEKSSTRAREKTKKKNIVWLLLDDVSTERFPEYGNQALEGLLPGWDEFKADGAVYYPHFYSVSSICAPAQVSLFSSMDPADIGGQYQFSGDVIPGKEPYATVPPEDVQFIPEFLRSLGYYATGGGKLDYQVGEVMPTFYHEILGGAFSDVSSYMERSWGPAIEQGRPFFAMLNLMDNHQFFTTLSREAPIPITDSLTGEPAPLPFGQFGYSPPLSLVYDTGPNGTAQPGVTARTDLLEAEILGYRGAYDETSLSHDNGSIPGYLPDDIGIKSILSREYDMIRNLDYRLCNIIKRLKELEVYDDTMIVLFGDHGSGIYKAKLLLQPQSVRTPLWIKYPKDMELSRHVETDRDTGNLVDNRMTTITDLYPTTLSVIGVKPPRYMAGRAVAGHFETQEAEREMLFALVHRMVDTQGLKTFAAFSKDFFYQKHLLTKEAIDSRELRGEDASVIANARRNAGYAYRFEIFPASPMFDRMLKLMLVNGLNPTYADRFKFITATDAAPPSEVLFDLRADPYGTENLIVNSTYVVGVSEEIQKWGNHVANVTVDYSAVDESGLSDLQHRSLRQLRDGLSKWVRNQRWTTDTLDWSEGLWGEENRMAREFWPNGVQPVTDVVNIDIDGVMTCETGGAVFRYAAVPSQDRNACEQLGVLPKTTIAEMTPTNSGIVQESYVSARNGRTYVGFLYIESSGRVVDFSNFLGSVEGCSVFISMDATFMEADCPGVNPYVFDTRDSTWDGSTWIGVDPETGEWIDEPWTLYDSGTKTWNFKGFNTYFFGPKRNEIFSGLNPDGTRFEPALQHETPFNFGYNPAPFYFATDEDVNVYPGTFDPDEVFAIGGWSLASESSYFRSISSAPGVDDKGSFFLNVNRRTSSPPRDDFVSFKFDSFQYECLSWEVDTTVDVSSFLKETTSLAVFTQGVRKGYKDSIITEFAIERLLDGTNVFV